MSPAEPVGLQNERTALAWSRTALSLLAAAAAITRLTYSALGNYSALCLVLSTPLAVWIFWQSRSRYRQWASNWDGSTRDGGAALGLTTMTVILGLTETMAILMHL